MNRPRWNEDWPAYGIVYGLLAGVILWAVMVMIGLAAWIWWMGQ